MRIIPAYRDLHGASFAGAFAAHVRRSWHVNLLLTGGVIVVTQGVVWHLRYREQETDAARLKAAVAEAEIHAMKMQLHPHFLFNALHSISTLMHRDVETADRMLIQLSDVLRNTIDASRMDVTALEDEVSYLEKYLAIEKLRFRDRLTVDIDVPPHLGKALVPNLVLQPLVENAFRHGFEPRSGRFHLWIRARRERDVQPPGGNGSGTDQLILEVEDDGAGLPASGTFEPGVGITLTRERIHLMYGSNASLQVHAREDSGVVATVRLPLNPSV
jgi:LytS/YehU family sensor histidine kinase